MPFHGYDEPTGWLITTVIREGRTPKAGEIVVSIKRIVKRIRRRFPGPVPVFRAVCHNTKPTVMNWMRANNVQWVTGLGPSKRLGKDFASLIEQARQTYADNRVDRLDSREFRRRAVFAAQNPGR